MDKVYEGWKIYDKFAISATLLDVSFKGASCSILEAQIVHFTVVIIPKVIPLKNT